MKVFLFGMWLYFFRRISCEFLKFVMSFQNIADEGKIIRGTMLKTGIYLS